MKSFFVSLFLASFACTLAAAAESSDLQNGAILVKDYIRFLQARATSDEAHHYNEKMSASSCSQITRSGESGRYHYQAEAEQQNAPMSYLNANDAADYCIWKNQQTSTHQELLPSTIDHALRLNHFYFQLLESSHSMSEGMMSPTMLAPSLAEDTWALFDVAVGMAAAVGQEMRLNSYTEIRAAQTEIASRTEAPLRTIADQENEETLEGGPYGALGRPQNGQRSEVTSFVSQERASSQERVHINKDPIRLNPAAFNLTEEIAEMLPTMPYFHSSYTRIPDTMALSSSLFTAFTKSGFRKKNRFKTTTTEAPRTLARVSGSNHSYHSELAIPIERSRNELSISNGSLKTLQELPLDPDLQKKATFFLAIRADRIKAEKHAKEAKILTEKKSTELSQAQENNLLIQQETTKLQWQKESKMNNAAIAIKAIEEIRQQRQSGGAVVDIFAASFGHNDSTQHEIERELIKQRNNLKKMEIDYDELLLSCAEKVEIIKSLTAATRKEFDTAYQYYLTACAQVRARMKEETASALQLLIVYQNKSHEPSSNNGADVQAAIFSEARNSLKYLNEPSYEHESFSKKIRRSHFVTERSLLLNPAQWINDEQTENDICNKPFFMGGKNSRIKNFKCPSQEPNFFHLFSSHHKD